MRIIIIGAVAAGTSAAAKARRNTEEADIIIYEKDSFISYSGCGMPYYIGDIVENADELSPRTPEYFKHKYNVDILILHEVLSINPEKKTLEIKSLATGEIFTDTYDSLIIATGAKAVIPNIIGVNSINVFTLRNINDMNKIKNFINLNNPKSAVIIGTGSIGLEMCENLKKLGIEIKMVEKLPQVTPGLDSDMAVYVKEHLEKNGVTIITDVSAYEINGNSVKLSDGTTLHADIIIISVGIQPDTALAKQANIELGIAGAIKVDAKMMTNQKDVFACGDCIESFHVITGKTMYRPLGSTANKTGRIAGDCASGGNLEFRGILGTWIFEIFDMAVAQTGLSEHEAIKQGYDIAVCHNIKPNKPEYMGGKEMVIKGIANKIDGRLLGVQIIGFEGVDKRIDVFATAITFKAKVDDLFHLDLAYAPPFSTTKDPVMYTGMILDNAINKGRHLITAQELYSLIQSGEKVEIIDTRTPAQYEKGHIKNADSIPHAIIRETAAKLDLDVITVTYCNKGVTGNAVQNILINRGFKKAYNLSGGYSQFKKIKPDETTKK